MISIHRIEDLCLRHHGYVGTSHWFEFEVITREGVQEVTLYTEENTNAYKKIMEIIDFLAIAAVVNKVKEIEDETTE